MVIHVVRYFTTKGALLTSNSVKVQYEGLRGWEEPITSAKTFYYLPNEAREYVDFIEKIVRVKVQYIGVGPGREIMITR
jgi:adenylosuccinate synthase